MAQIRVMKIDTDGVLVEHALTDDITFTSFTVNGGGPVLSATGLDMNSTDIVDIEDVVFEDPTTSTINQTAGNLVIDNIMAKERENLMTTAGGISFPVISDSAGEVDAFRLPSLAGAPTATPTTGGSGHLVFDTTNNDLYIWDGAAWDNLNIVEQANQVANEYTAGEALAAVDALYISDADEVSKADVSAGGAASRVMGFAKDAALAAAAVTVVSEGVLDGFTGLTAGSRYYADPATPGAITATTPVGTGNSIVQVGYAKSATELHIHIEQLGRRA